MEGEEGKLSADMGQKAPKSFKRRFSTNKFKFGSSKNL